MRNMVVDEASAGVRLDVFVAKAYPQFTRSSLERLFDLGMVTLNGKAQKASYSVQTGQKITIDESLLNQKIPDIKLPIIYEDEDVTVIDKPAGLLTHSKGALNTEATIASFIAGKVDPELGGNRAGIVHRLDRHTSGIIITAKNKAALSWLQKLFSQRRVKKQYLAVAEGIVEPEAAIIDAPIARNTKKPQTFIVSNNGRPALTQYRVLKTFQRNTKYYSLLELKPQTGRTHQLRVHLAYIGHPIVGDRVYGKAGDRMLLHAASLELTLPNKERRVFKSATPKEFNEFINGN